MDNVCHTLVGAAFGEAGLRQRTRFGGATLMIASNLPDLDVLAFATSVPSVAIRRGWTHGPVADLCLPLLLTLAMYIADRRRPAPAGRVPPLHVGWVFLLSCLGVLSHVGLDLLNNYGVRLLMPFENGWYYGDTLFIIDPWLWLALGAGVWVARRWTGPQPARWALVAVAVYIVAMTVTARMAREFVIDAWRAEHGAAPIGVMVGPVPVTPLRRDVIVDAGSHYVRGAFTWFPARVTFDTAVTPKNDADPRVARARAASSIQGFLIWSRFPFWTFGESQEGATATVSDMRFAGRGRPFVQTVPVD